MTTIKDIRIYRSSVENTDVNSLPTGFADRELSFIIHRVVMKLRENARELEPMSFVF